MEYTTKEMRPGKGKDRIKLRWTQGDEVIDITLGVQAAQVLLDNLDQNGEPFFITRNGEKILRIFPMESFKKQNRG